MSLKLLQNGTFYKIHITNSVLIISIGPLINNENDFNLLKKVRFHQYFLIFFDVFEIIC